MRALRTQNKVCAGIRWNPQDMKHRVNPNHELCKFQAKEESTHTQATENPEDVVRQKASVRPPGERVTVDVPQFNRNKTWTRTRIRNSTRTWTRKRTRAICLEVPCSETYDSIPTYPHVAEPYIQAKPLHRHALTPFV
jgi:hypothetical protein